MVDFGGWDMPVNYGSQIDEHRAVRGNAGMFDVSHMRVVDVAGAGARAFLRYVLANNVDKLQSPGKALYSCLLKPDGTVLDDLIVYFFRDDYFRIVVNAGTADKDIAWLRDRIAESATGVALTPRPDLAIIAVQGPSARALGRCRGAGLRPLKPFRGFRGGRKGTRDRAGRLQGNGFEIARWRLRLKVCGRARRIGRRPVRPGARDTLRLEAGMNLRPGHGRDRVPLESGLAGRRSQESARFHRQGGAAGAPRVAAAGRPRARGQGRRAAGASDRAYRSGRR
jgi:aminomethyltransferase